MGRLRQFNRMQAVFHAMHSGIEQSVSGLSGRAAIGITICWMSGIGRGSRFDSRSRATQISLNLAIDLGILQLLIKVFYVHSGTTAVTSISTLARSSTRSATCTSVMAG